MVPLEETSLVLVFATAALIFLGGLAFTHRDGRMTISELWTLLLGVVVFPSMVLFAGFNAAMENSQDVTFCGTKCHVMAPYYDDLLDPESESLAAVHYQNRYILEEQCYQCHTSYAMFGPLKSKMDGVMHVWNYYTGGWEEPIKLRGEYRISNCLRCHGEAKRYRESHEDYLEELASGEASCLDCHGDIHPRPEAARLMLRGGSR